MAKTHLCSFWNLPSFVAEEECCDMCKCLFSSSGNRCLFRGCEESICRRQIWGASHTQNFRWQLAHHTAQVLRSAREQTVSCWRSNQQLDMKGGEQKKGEEMREIKEQINKSVQTALFVRFPTVHRGLSLLHLCHADGQSSAETRHTLALPRSSAVGRDVWWRLAINSLLWTVPG